MSLPNAVPMSATQSEFEFETRAATAPTEELSWSQQLKQRLEHLQKPSSPAFELYPGTPVYLARRALIDAIESTWRVQLLRLVRGDLEAGHTGRRKHHWEQNQCLVVYELVDGAESLNPCPDGASEAARETYLSKACKDALYVIVPNFSAKLLKSPTVRNTFLTFSCLTHTRLLTGDFTLNRTLHSFIPNFGFVSPLAVSAPDHRV